uniref:Uncharacterized protein n=1 Tax=Glossina brevipalpis TaxID=37001 RepID=A0A1A9X260_9MUSC
MAIEPDAIRSKRFGIHDIFISINGFVRRHVMCHGFSLDKPVDKTRENNNNKSIPGYHLVLLCTLYTKWLICVLVCLYVLCLHDYQDIQFYLQSSQYFTSATIVIKIRVELYSRNAYIIQSFFDI